MLKSTVAVAVAFIFKDIMINFNVCTFIVELTEPATNTAKLVSGQ